MKSKEAQEKLGATMKTWQGIENQSVEMAAQINRRTDNPVIRAVMAIIMQDSTMHHRVQQLITDSLEREAISLRPEELGEIWTLIEDHIAMERKTIDQAKAALDAVKDSKMMVVQRYFLEYLLADEEKHNRILDNLEAIKKGIYPYA